jgi:nucleoside-diphosphate-sugar epimerase
VRSITPGDLVRQDCEEAVANGDVSRLDELRGKTILVTGGTGFVGTWLAEMVAYLNDRHDFGTHLFLLSTDTSAWNTRAPHLSRRRDITLQEQDVRTVLELPESVSWIIHAAGTPDNRMHSTNPLRTIHTILNGTDAVLTAAARLPNLQKVLNISSGLTYGSQPLDIERIPETFQGISPDANAITSVYREAKRMAETLCAAHRSQNRIAIVNARPFAFVGPYQLLDRPWAINNFVRDALTGGPIRILGDGETVRSYMYAADMAWWVLNLLVHGVSGVSYNVGSDDPITLKALAEKIAECFPRSLSIELRGMHDSHLRKSRFVPDTTLARVQIGLQYHVTIENALRRTLDWNRAWQSTRDNK